ncbi:conjugal transfer protein TraC [Candidatus Uhrbacteria bacterium CG10_big_fil_rev_8_21_14_0_10_48_11]|uniref:Conjugal transfer protein TraC n=1 Tax=Candidatus Uhrbacteria bacterium CG10_big_fil_rev_8_21_14_0_10_48_11 TaxID=1975037 RepID=A0A2M8LFQ1_9BACT|nr:MAG: conjugal transfer protein TraC [Candidatus Uhrbacteria bacterium CG10_big_fil_rev_8_21_14_0_10_48_11]
MIGFNKKKKQPKTVEEKALSPKEGKEVLAAAEAYRAGTIKLRDLVAPSALEIEASYIKLNDQFVRTIFVTDYPRYISVGWFAPLINISGTIDLSLYVYPVDAAVILKQLKNKVGALEAEIVADHEKGAPRDPIKETALHDIERLRDDLTQGVEKFFQFGLYITIYADSLEHLNTATDDIIQLLGTKLVYARKVLYQAEQGFISTVPLGVDELQITFNMNSSPISSAFPFVSSELTSDNGILYGINRHNNSLILFDRFSLQNANTVVFATSGAGKSYTVKLEVLRSLMMGVDIIVIDPEKEYEHLSEAVGGTYLNISLSSESKVNPFDLPKGIGEDVQTGDIIRSAVITLKGLLRIMLGRLTSEEDSLLDRALLETYAKKDITADADLINVEPPVLADLEDVLEGMQGTKDLVARLQKYTRGTFAGLLNSPTNVITDSQLVVFSIRDLEDELRPIAMYTIINNIWNLVRSERKKRILIIEEAWIMMQHEDSAKFIFALAKRARKYYLGLTTISQDVNDFLGSPYGQAVVNNSAMQLLLKQSPAAIDLIQKTFLLTEGEKYLLLEGSVGEGIFFAGPKHAAIKVVASYTEDQLITTDPRQLLEMEAAKEQVGGDDTAAVQGLDDVN